jgi:hypothetical protein
LLDVVGRQLAAFQLPDLGAHGLEKVAIVRDDQERARIARDERLEPSNGIDVEVVRRLVEDDPVGLFEERLREQGAGSLTTGELAQGTVEVGLGEREAVQRRAHLPFGGELPRERLLERRAKRRRTTLGGILCEITKPLLASAHDRSAVRLVATREEPNE